MTAPADTAREAARGTGLVLAGALLAQAFEYLYRFTLARGLGVDGFGTFNEARSALLVVAGLATFGLGAGVKQFVAMHRESGREPEARRAIRDGSRLVAVSALGGGALFWFLAEPLALAFGNPALGGPIRVLAFALPAIVGLDYVTRLGEALRSFRPTVLGRQIVDPGLRLVISVALVLAGASIPVVMGAYAVAAVSGLAVAAVLVARLAPLRALARGAAPPQTTALLRFSVPLVFGGVLFDLAERIDVIMLGALLGEHDVGVYAAGSALARVLLLFAASALPVVATLAAEAVGRGAPEDIARLHRMTSRWALFFTTPLACGLLLYPSEAISLLFGREYAGAAGALRVLVPAYAAVILAGPIGVIVNSLGKTHWTLANVLFRVVANVGLNLLLIPRFGIVGAAYGTLLALVVATVLLRIQLGRLVSLKGSWSGWGRPLAVLGLATLVSFGASRAWAGLGIGGEQVDLVAALVGGLVLLVTFGVGVRVVGCLEPDDLALVDLARGKLRPRRSTDAESAPSA